MRQIIAEKPAARQSSFVTLAILISGHTSRSMGLQSFGTDLNVAVFGAGGGIGGAFVQALRADPAVAQLHAISRNGEAGGGTHTYACDPLDNDALAATMATITADTPLHLAITTIGILHGEGIAPEKTWRHIEADAMRRIYEVNTIAPTLIARHVLPALAKGRKTAHAVLGARVGSIGDNRLGGWVSYRASKAALAMVIRTLSIELARTNPHALFIGLHPGTVDTALSQPFQQGVAQGKLSTPDHAVHQMLNTIDTRSTTDNGNVFACNETKIPH